jgi:hypothetical protein
MKQIKYKDLNMSEITRKDVMYGFAVEENITKELLADYQAKHPQFADDLKTLFVELTRKDGD